MPLKLHEQRFSQEPHSCAPSDCDPSLSIRLDDAGAGEYLVLNAEEYALDSMDEVEELAEKLRWMMRAAKP